MSPFRRTDSRHWQVAPTITLPGRGRVRLPARTTRETRRARAEAIEATLRALPGMGYSDLLEAYIADPTLTPDELHAAKMAGRLDELRERQADPDLRDVLARARAGTKDRAVLVGMDTIERLAPAGARFSLLTDRRAVRAMLEAREAEGVKRNTVRRCLYRAIATTLAVELPKARRLEILGELEYGSVDDERRIQVTKADLDRLFSLIVEPAFRELVRVAVTTGIDRGALLKIRPRHLDGDRLQVFDRKTSSRMRVIRIPDVAQAAIRRTAMFNRAGPNDRVWTYTGAQVYSRWRAAAVAADLEYDGFGILRFKDLRAVFATAYLAAGGNIKELMHIMGHTQLATTVRYVKRLPLEQSADMAAAAAWLGVDRYLEAG